MDPMCVDFLNSLWRDWRGSGRSEDRLDQPEWLDQFLSKWGLEVDDPNPPPGDALKELRDLLWRMVKALNEERLSDDDLAQLNAVWQRVPQYRRLLRVDTGYLTELVPPRKDWNWVLAEIAASFADLLIHHDPRRIKICENPDCLWVFYDESRNRSLRWCDDSYCGNLMKVRRFRARQKGASESP